jgi:hypothetical protein
MVRTGESFGLRDVGSTCISFGFDDWANFFAFGSELDAADGKAMTNFVILVAVGGGDLEAVEEESGAFGVDLVSG